MTTALDKALKRQLTIDGAEYTVTIDPDGVRLTGKGKRNAAVMLRWSDLLSGDAALAVALNASLDGRATGSPPKAETSDKPKKTVPKTRPR